MHRQVAAGAANAQRAHATSHTSCHQTSHQTSHPDTAVRRSPFRDVWEDDETGEERRLIERAEDGGEIEEAAEWYARAILEEEEAWNEEVEDEARLSELRRSEALKATTEREKTAAKVGSHAASR